MSAEAPSIERTEPVPRPSGGSGPGLRTAVSAAIGRRGLRGLALLYLAVLVVLPVVAVIDRGFGHGLAPWKAAIAEPGGIDAIKLTLWMAALTAGINAVFGTMIAYVLVRYRFPGRSLLSAVVDVPFAVPTLVTGLMLVALYGPSSPVGGYFLGHGIHVIFARAGILLALLFVTLPLVVRTVQPVLLELDLAEEEAAHVLGAGRVATFRRVVLPHLRPGIVAGSLLVFARALGEFGAVVIVSGNLLGRTLTAPVFISQLIGSFKPEEAAAIATLLFVLSFGLVLVVERLVARNVVAT